MEEFRFSTFGLPKASRNDVAAKMGLKIVLGGLRGLQKEILDEISAIQPMNAADQGAGRRNARGPSLLNSTNSTFQFHTRSPLQAGGGGLID